MTPDPAPRPSAHPNRTLVVLAGARARVRAGPDDDRPRAARHPARRTASAPPTRPGCSPSSCSPRRVTTPLLGRLGDMYGKERLLLVALGVFGARHARRARSAARSACSSPGARSRALGGAIFPLAIGIVRDEFPREKVATRDRHHLGDVRHRRRRSASSRRACSSTTLASHWIFWLGLAARVRGRVGHLALRARVARARAGAHRLGRRGAAGASLGALLLGVSQGNAWGWTSARRARAVRRRGRARRRLRRLRATRTPRPAGRHRADGQRPVWTTNLVGFAVGFAMFGSFILIPAARADARRRRLRLRRVGHRAAACSCCPRARRHARSRGRSAGRLGASLGSQACRCCWGRSRPRRLLLARLRARHASSEIYVGSTLLGIGIGLAFAAMANLSWSPCRRTRPAWPRHQHDHALDRRRRRRAGRRGARHGRDRHPRGGRLPGRERLHGGLRHERRGAIVALLATLAVPGTLRRDRSPAAGRRAPSRREAPSR